MFLNGQDLKFSITGSAQPKLTQAAMNKIPVPLLPLAEQKRIVAEVERRLSVVEELETVVLANLQRATRLRQAILQRAFEGRLVNMEAEWTSDVPQDLPLAAESPSTYRRPSERTRE
jgi:type I restriction enzyme S subunit